MALHKNDEKPSPQHTAQPYGSGKSSDTCASPTQEETAPQGTENENTKSVEKIQISDFMDKQPRHQNPHMEPNYQNMGPVTMQTPVIADKPQGRRRKKSKVNTAQSAILHYYSPVIDWNRAGFLVPQQGGSALLMEPEIIAPQMKKLVRDHLDEDVSDRHVKDALESLYLSAKQNCSVESGRTWLNRQTGERFIEIDNYIWVFPKENENRFSPQNIPYCWRFDNQFSYTLQSIQGPSASEPSNIRRLAEYVRLPDNRDILLYAFLVLCMMPEREALALELAGEDGLNTSRLQELIKELIDPVVRGSALRDLPKQVKSLDDLAWQHNVLNFDQIEETPTLTIQRRLYEFLCGTDLDWKASKGRMPSVSSLHVRRVCLLGSLDSVVSQRELRERTLSIEMPLYVQADVVRNAKKVQWLYEKPTILGGLLGLLGKAHAQINGILLLRQLPNGWHDFCKIGMVVAQALTGNDQVFWEQFDAYQEERSQEILEQDPVALAIQQYLSVNDVQGVIEKSAAEWKLVFDPFRPEWAEDKEWPQKPRGIGAALKKAAPLLRSYGITCYSNGKRGSRCRWVIGYQNIEKQHMQES
ncbi:hypothetical protein QC823_15660 [Halomonas vilamensis]|uniref:Uncharacterized protein n=1 Tax=Vreelandella vilamensis TaxID=531309 RepID=A0ABU1H7X4_9GAMM|nr:hypothetical protein [Halomonas vilamensis]MDR5900401.1 hypothetical protein [Halomonas vilamensis]